IYNENIGLQYNMQTAGIDSYSHKGNRLLQGAPHLSFWREATDNDLVDRNGSRLWQHLNPATLRRNVIATNYRKLDASTVAVDAMIRYTDPQGALLFDVKQSLAVTSAGDVLLDNEIVASGNIQAMPRVGLIMPLSDAFDTVQWMGLDKETYRDRRQSGKMGTYMQAITDMTFPYERNQEAGNRADVRWMAVTRPGEGLFVDMLDTLFNISFNGHLLHVDYRQGAIGSALAGIPIAEEDLITGKTHRFRVHMRAYDPVDYAPQDFRRVLYPEVKSTVLPMPVISKNRERFDAPMLITLNTETPKAELHYTLDGTTPTLSSPLYTKPFTIDASTVVMARAFLKGSTPSFTAMQKYVFDYIVSATFAGNASTPYNFNQETILFNAEKGDVNDLSHGWLGFSGKDMDVTLTLSKAINLQDVEMNFAHVPNAWAFAPVQVLVSVSSDGQNFTAPVAAKIKYDPSSEDMNGTQRVSVRVEMQQSDVRYVRVVARALDKIPSWHKAKGLKPWVLIDEITLNETIK
ncbi:MAG: chitobiase/beta-hexosaminidase C-terminal domain-containing protein, partial [Bacteroidales bacterium]|nr:chitobiase/beta-hexosaminidase C-terminal domain-containing protein [Bacteroidales bacterium]